MAKTRKKVTAVILFAGRGKRMNSEISKQYMDLCGKPVICHTLGAFQNSMADEIIAVVESGGEEYCRTEIAEKFGFTKIRHIVAGGVERYNSVYNGLLAAKDCGYVLIHDGARPFITPGQINMLINETWSGKACVAGVPVKDTIKQTDDNNNIIGTPDRRKLWQAQTPQCFEYSIIKKAYDNMINNHAGMEQGMAAITDDAAVLELYDRNIPIKIIEISYENIKITTPEDIFIGESILKKRENAFKMRK